MAPKGAQATNSLPALILNETFLEFEKVLVKLLLRNALQSALLFHPAQKHVIGCVENRVGFRGVDGAPSRGLTLWHKSACSGGGASSVRTQAAMTQASITHPFHLA